MRKKALMMILVAGFFVFATNAFALAPGASFTFSDTISDVKKPPWTWTHTLSNADFDPDLDGTEPYLIIDSGNLALNLKFKPNTPSPYTFSLNAYLDSSLIGNLYLVYDSPAVVHNYFWSINIEDQTILNAIADKSATILLTPTTGTIKKVNSSILSGSGVVAPEPISMLLVGIGMAGLPFAGRLRRLIER